LEPLKRLLIARTEGNPFFLEESVRTLVEMEVLVGQPGAYRLAQPLDSLQVPATVHAVLAARIDRLPSAEEKRLLQTAAVIGTEVPFALLQAIAELPEDTLHGGLAHLQAAEFLYETRLFPEREYTFKHALTHEVAYGGLLQERRRVLHARIAEALEEFVGDRVAEQVERLAHHALRGEVWDKALTYCRQAGEKAMARSAHREAVGYFEQALGALPHLPETLDTREQAIDLRLVLRAALLPSGDLGRILAYMREAEALATALDDSHRLGQVSVYLSNHFRNMGVYDQAIATAQRALALATASGEVVLHTLANFYLGFTYLHQGDYRRAIDCLGQTVVVLDGARRHERFGQVFLPAVQSRAWLAWSHAELGTFAEGSVLGDEGLQIAEAVAHPGSLMAASLGIGLLSLRHGDLPRALPRLERAIGICQDADLPYRCSRRHWNRRLQRKWESIRRSVVFPWGRRICWPAAGRRHTPSPSGRWRMPVRTRNAATKPMPCASSATLRRGAIPPRAHRPKPTTGRPWLSPTNSACARSKPIATSASGSCTPRLASTSRPAPP
jgi:tetratricopeptide (TPR) repeat protein